MTTTASTVHPNPDKMHVVIIGASRGVGYYCLLNLLRDQSTSVTVLLRNPAVLSSDPAVAPYIASGQVTVLQGDATNADDLVPLFKHFVDAVLVTVGPTPAFTWSGVKLDNPTVCTVVAQSLLSTLHKVDQRPPPRVVAVSSMGVGENHKVMPLAMRILYPAFLSTPHADKAGYEYLLQRAAVQFSTPNTGLPRTNILSEMDRAAAPKSFLPEVIIVRPAFFTNSEERGQDKIKSGESASVYTISRKDVAGFISSQCLPGQGGGWVNRAPVIGY